MSDKQLRWARRGFGLLVTVVLVIQIALIARQALPELASIRQDLGKAGAWRGADFAFNQETANYLEWISQRVPEDVEILVAADTGPEQLSRPAALQVFLYPHQLYNCPGEAYQDCVQAALEAGRAALVTTPDRLADLLANNKTNYQGFNEAWGLLYAGSAPLSGPTYWQNFASLISAILSSLPPLIAIALISLAGFELVVVLAPTLERSLQIALGYGLGSALYSLLIFLALLAGFTLGPALLGTVLLILLLTPLATGQRLRSGLKQSSFAPGWMRGLSILVLWGVAVALAAGRGYARSDEYLLWGAKGYGILVAGLQTGATEWGTLTTHYPLNIPLLISSFLAGFGDQLPQSKLLFPFFYVAMILVGWTFLRRRLNRLWALAGVALLAGSPLVFQHASLAYANLPFAFFMVAGSLLAVDHARGSQAWLAGLFFASAAWTRPEGLSILWVLVLVSVVFSHGRRLLRHVRDWLPMLTPLMLYHLLWAVAAPLAYSHSGFSQGLLLGGLSSLLAGNVNWAEAGFLLKQFAELLLSFEAWAGLAIFGLPIIMLVVTKKGSQIERSALLLLGQAMLFTAIILSSYYLTSYQPDNADISWWVSTGLDRMLMPGALLFGLAAFLGSAQALGVSSDHQPFRDVPS